jgi:hypothetical protein
MSFMRFVGERGERRRRRGSLWAAGLALAFLLVTVASSQATHLFSDTAGHTTLERIVTGDDPDNGYSELRSELVNGSHLVRDGASEGNAAIPTAQSKRAQRRRSLAYLGQLTDFQLADEESPARVEFLDPGASSAWRPQEALAPFIIDWSIRQLNLFTTASPVPQGDATRASMDFSLMTGDQADNAQRNETIWVRELLEGGQALNFNSGSTNPNDYDPTVHPSCANFPPTNANRQEALRYTGVQDYDDYDESQTPLYYDPDEPRGSWAAAGWPTYTGLMDRAQRLTITPAGTAVPSYLTNGNHDPLAQGNEDPIEAFESIATGCLKTLASTVQPGPGVLDPNVLLAPAAASTLVPPDPLRRYVSKPQIKAVYGENGQDDAHGFDFVDPAEAAASNNSASYYAWDPPETPEFRFVSIDTVSEGGQTAEGVGCGSANGNIDDPQFQWLDTELAAASARNKPIVIFGHHPVRSMCTEIADEQAQLCTTQHNHGDVPEHDRNPGCDLDPRSSEPIHLGRDPQPGDPRESFVELLDRYPNVVAYIAGHTHENNIESFPRSAGDSAWWAIETSATADWPVQHRLIEVMDNRDGTLSIFGTLLDHAAAAAAPPEGSAAGFGSAQLASIGRTFTYNDPQVGAGSGEGGANDQNVELLVRNPRGAPLCAGREATIVGTSANDNLVGTSGDDVILGLEGNDTISGLGGNDVICGGDGNDTLNGGDGPDLLSGQAGSDTAGYATRSAGVTVDIDNAPDDGNAADGPAGARDNVRTDMENIRGGAGNDTLTGNAAANTLEGRDGADVLSGLGGTDTATYAARTAGVTVDPDNVADDGNSIDGPAGARDNVKSDIENVTGGKGADTLTGSAVANRLTGGLGADSLFGLGANDALFANDGTADTTINCGGGTADVAHVDSQDPATIGCESVGP